MGWKAPGQLRDEQERKILEKALEAGFLRLSGSDARQRRLSQAWFLNRKARDLPIVEATYCFSYSPRQAYILIEAELTGSWWLTNRLLGKLKAHLKPSESLHCDGDSFCISGTPPRLLVARSREVLDLILATRPTEDERYDGPPRLVEGYFRCLNALGFEEDLIEGHSYFLREIPEQPGHALVFRPGRPLLVGVHLDRFEY